MQFYRVYSLTTDSKPYPKALCKPAAIAAGFLGRFWPTSIRRIAAHEQTNVHAKTRTHARAGA